MPSSRASGHIRRRRVGHASSIVSLSRVRGGITMPARVAALALQNEVGDRSNTARPRHEDIKFLLTGIGTHLDSGAKESIRETEMSKF